MSESSSKSILFNRASRKPVSLAGQLKMAMFKAVCELCDVVSFVSVCPSDSSMMLTLDNTTSDFWIPSVKVQPGESWEKNMAKDLQELFGSIPNPKMLRLNKLWLSNHKYSYVSHTVFQIDVNQEQKKKSKACVGRFRGKVRWVVEDELLRFSGGKNLKSPELVEYFYLSKNHVIPNNFSTPPGYRLSGGNFLEVSDDVVVSGKSTMYEQIVDASGIDRPGQEALYREFLLVCFPAIYMSSEAFSRFLVEAGWPKDETPSLFRAADANLRNGLSFREFLYFVAAVEPATNHGGGPAELRCRYIFRYFDSDRNNLLKSDELRAFVVSVRKFRKQPLDAPKVDKELEECYKSLGVPDTHALTMPEFLKAVGELKVRGTSQIFRAPHSIQKYIKDCVDRDNRAKASVRAAEAGGKSTMTVDASKASMQPYAKGQEFELAVHTIKIQKSGTAINVDQLFSLDTAVSFSSTKVPIINEVMRRVSIDQFSQTSQAGELLKALRYLSQVNKKMTCYLKPEQMQFTWGQLDSTIMAKILMNVCNQVKDVFMKEQRLLDLSSPIYVMGDLHGNFADLLYFEKVLWHVGPGLCPCNLLFLGDYVDRGAFSIEVISYLFSYKLQSPKKLKMLRGNHEIKRVQIQWTFEKECKIKFGDKVGTQVFNVINDTFDTMPLAAVIDGRVFCAHGGIPPPWLCPVVAAINDIPIVLNEPQNQSPLAWELMWNDPVRAKHMNEKLSMELLANEGFAMNFRRGTAHVFNVEALENFLKINGFTHMIRAHEVVESGFHVQQKGKLLTVFSSSKYCGGQNEAACILVDQGKLRIMRLETDV